MDTLMDKTDQIANFNIQETRVVYRLFSKSKMTKTSFMVL